jgi:hypothetical protein
MTKKAKQIKKGTKSSKRTKDRHSLRMKPIRHPRLHWPNLPGPHQQSQKPKLPLNLRRPQRTLLRLPRPHQLPHPIRLPAPKRRKRISKRACGSIRSRADLPSSN